MLPTAPAALMPPWGRLAAAARRQSLESWIEPRSGPNPERRANREHRRWRALDVRVGAPRVLRVVPARGRPS